MDNELMRACSLYCEICDRTNNGNGKGMPIREIRKKYGLKKRDIVVLLQFLIEIADRDSCVDFVEYNSDGCIQGVDVSNVEEVAANGEIYIRIIDRGAYLPKKRMEEGDFNIQNETLLQNLSQKDIFNVIREISNVSEENLSAFIVSKGTERKSIVEKKKKQKLISAILNRNAVQITKYGEKNGKKKIYPMGLRYIKLLNTYQLVYVENLNQQAEDMKLSEISTIEILSEKYDREFHIYDYIQQKKTQKIVLAVYCEGNVGKKIDLILSEYEIKKIEKENYIEYHFLAENADMFENMIKSFGRSVIVKEPAYLREKIYRSTKEILDFYKTGM